MLEYVKRYLGIAWASPVTIIGLVYSLFMLCMGWCSWYGIRGNALVFVLNSDRMPPQVFSSWQRWSGQTFGNVIFLKLPPRGKMMTLNHHLQHVEQYMRLGIFLPVVYLLCHFTIKYGCPESNEYHDNPFEVDARRKSGQVVDVLGMMKKIKEAKKRHE